MYIYGNSSRFTEVSFCSAWFLDGVTSTCFIWHFHQYMDGYDRENKGDVVLAVPFNH